MAYGNLQGNKEALGMFILQQHSKADKPELSQSCRGAKYNPKPNQPFPETIVVPFPVESKLSGACNFSKCRSAAAGHLKPVS